MRKILIVTVHLLLTLSIHAAQIQHIPTAHFCFATPQSPLLAQSEPEVKLCSITKGCSEIDSSVHSTLWMFARRGVRRDDEFSMVRCRFVLANPTQLSIYPIESYLTILLI